MKITVLKPTTVHPRYIEIDILIRYDDDVAADFPGRNGKRIRLLLDLDERKVADWPAGRVEGLHLKVCDEGTYRLLDADRAELAVRQSYVPAPMPNDHYGDYVILDIDGTWSVGGWWPDADDVAEAFFPTND